VRKRLDHSLLAGFCQGDDLGRARDAELGTVSQFSAR
jgi:hypothetical protein